jgi:hypothetical protein
MINTRIKRWIGLAPAPIFLILGIYSELQPNHSSICGDHAWLFGLREMTLMWILMSAAHVLPWIFWWEQRRYKYRAVSDQQQ